MRQAAGRILAVGTMASFLAGPVAAQSTAPLAVGALAPDFTLTAATREGVSKVRVRLSDLKGQTIVLAFFYQARTKG